MAHYRHRGDLDDPGQSTFGKYNNGITVTRLTVQNSGNTPGGIIFDGNTGVAPVMSVGNDTQLSFIGTSSAHCFVQTKSLVDGRDSPAARQDR